MPRYYELMNINELIEALEEARDAMGGETEVYVATQPSYPLTNTIKAVVMPEEPVEGQDAPEQEVLWIGVDQIGSHSKMSPYAPSWAFES